CPLVHHALSPLHAVPVLYRRGARACRSAQDRDAVCAARRALDLQARGRAVAGRPGHADVDEREAAAEAQGDAALLDRVADDHAPRLLRRQHGADLRLQRLVAAGEREAAVPQRPLLVADDARARVAAARELAPDGVVQLAQVAAGV